MNRRGRLALATAFLLSGALAAQESGDPAIDAAMRDVRRYVGCASQFDRPCTEDMTYAEVTAALAFRDDGSRSTPPAFLPSPYIRPPDIEVATPWGPFSGGGPLFVLVPYFTSTAIKANGSRMESAGYFIGISDDAGENWRFVPTIALVLLGPDAIERMIPGLSAQPKPEGTALEVFDPPLERSRALRTTERGIVFVDGAFAYSLKLEIRRPIEAPVALSVRYDNPADREHPGYVLSSLQPGQQILEWQSPAMSAFVSGEIYDVLIEGRDPDTERLLFEHRQSVQFQPLREIWRSVMSKPPGERTN